MNSLKVKILGIVCIIVVAIITAAAVVNYKLQQQLIDTINDQNSAVLTETIKNSIADVMRTGHSDQVRVILNRIKSQDVIKAIRIYDTDGKILNSADNAEIGGNVPADDLSALKSGISHHHNGNISSSKAVIRNSPACHGCHDARKETLGILQVDVSLSYLDPFLATIKNNSIVSTAFIILLITVTISFFLIFYVDMPIRQLIRSMNELEHGDFEAKTIIKSSTEMSLLSEKYNEMVDRIKELMNTTVSHERELAIAQGKLAHHREIHQMNQRLEEQIREIEGLNVSLEERIEEIEEANYKIADLAGELEDKNTNLEKAVTRLSTLYKVGLAINSNMELNTLFRLIVDTTTATLNAQIAYIILYDREKENLKVTTMTGHAPLPPGGTHIPMKPSSVSTWVVNNCKPLLITDINDTPQFDRFSALGYERKTLICAPLITKDEIIGTITVVNKNDNTTYSNEELELLTTIAAQASIAIKNAKLYDEQQKTYLNTIHALVSAIEASDSYTRGHSERVTRFSLALARKLGLPQERMKIIERAAILHDIGKIGIDITLLHKQGKLSPEDIFDLQQHPVIGMKILEPIEFLHDVRLCIGQHHERFDDSFDAMTSNRPYRRALPLTVAIKELADNAGTQFDPHMVPLFVELLEEGEFTFLSESHAECTPHIVATA
jgi:putative nucleotidyltransferase with HDIG domain